MSVCMQILVANYYLQYVCWCVNDYQQHVLIWVNLLFICWYLNNHIIITRYIFLISPDGLIRHTFIAYINAQSRPDSKSVNNLDALNSDVPLLDIRHVCYQSKNTLGTNALTLLRRKMNKKKDIMDNKILKKYPPDISTAHLLTWSVWVSMFAMCRRVT